MTTTSTAPSVQTEFSAFFLEDTARLELDQPNGDPMLFNGKPVAVNLHGPATAQFIAALAKKEREATKRVVEAMAQKGKNAKQEADTDADSKFLCAVTASFENFPYPGGAEAIYREPRLKYINNQVVAHLSDLGNFYKNSEKN